MFEDPGAQEWIRLGTNGQPSQVAPDKERIDSSAQGGDQPAVLCLLFPPGVTRLVTAIRRGYAIERRAYTVAGALILKVSKRIYEGKCRMMDYVRDMSDQNESRHVQRWFLPAQLVRGLLLSVVLYPVLSPMGEMDFGTRFAFLADLMFIYTHIACAAPCADNIEGFVYMKPRYFVRTAFFKYQLEMLVYSALFAAAGAGLLT